MKIVRHIFLSCAVGACLLSAAGCAPQVQLTTPEPIKVDITMKVEVYQKEGATSTERKLSETENEALRRRDMRSGEVWAMKNDSVAVEGAHGYLEPHPKSGWDPAYIQRLVDEENKDRKNLYEAEATDTARPLAEIEAEAGKRFRQQSYSHGPAK